MARCANGADVTYGVNVATVTSTRGPGESWGGSLHERARRLSETYLGGLARPASVRFVDNQRLRWGSCTPDTGVIRLSADLRDLPEAALDYVLLHELAHLVVPEHGPGFDRLVDGFPRRAAARAILDAQPSPRAR